MAFSLIAHTGIGRPNGGGSTITTAPIDTTGADLIVAGVSDDDNNSADFSFLDSFSNVWTKIPTALGRSIIYYCVNPIVGPGHTFTFGCTQGTFAGDVQAWQGVDTGNPLDQSSQSNSTATSPTLTPSNNDALCISFSGPNPGVFTDSGAGFTVTDIQPLIGFGSYGNGMSYQLQTTPASTFAAWSPPTSFANTWLLIFNAAPNAVTVPVPAGSLAFNTFAPSLGASISVPAGSLAINSFPPVPQIGSLSINVPKGALTLQGFAPVVSSANVLIEVPGGSLSIIGFAPMLGGTLPVPAGAMVLTGFPPLVTIFKPGGGNHAAAWWWSGAAARMINDAGFLLLVEPHLEPGEGYDEGEIYTGEPQPGEGGE